MPDSHTNSSQAKPTAKQFAYLRSLADRTGQTFVYPQTRSQASAQIRRLRGERPTPRADRARERKQVADDLASGTGDAARIRRTEVTGYRSTATWSTSR